ncbi:hypothetical protein ACJMK2_013888 [Sinanodonta woodiana]|uniref:Uncharacterized protein n=1 Tax=Sinanodonta woodiana TaxID=1069815 RepID=A0ABD3UYW2_SINWO
MSAKDFRSWSHDYLAFFVVHLKETNALIKAAKSERKRITYGILIPESEYMWSTYGGKDAVYVEIFKKKCLIQKFQLTCASVNAVSRALTGSEYLDELLRLLPAL